VADIQRQTALQLAIDAKEGRDARVEGFLQSRFSLHLKELATSTLPLRGDLLLDNSRSRAEKCRSLEGNNGSLWELLPSLLMATFVTCLKVSNLAKFPRLRSDKQRLPKLRPSKGLRSDLIAYSDYTPED
jgi:hypothetical protein